MDARAKLEISNLQTPEKVSIDDRGKENSEMQTIFGMLQHPRQSATRVWIGLVRNIGLAADANAL